MLFSLRTPRLIERQTSIWVAFRKTWEGLTHYGLKCSVVAHATQLHRLQTLHWQNSVSGKFRKRVLAYRQNS